MSMYKIAKDQLPALFAAVSGKQDLSFRLKNAVRPTTVSGQKRRRRIWIR